MTIVVPCDKILILTVHRGCLRTQRGNAIEGATNFVTWNK